MAQTVGQIEAHIDRTRHQLGANLKELEHRVEAATDWRRQFRARPLAFLGVGFVAGAVIGAMLPHGRKRGRRVASAYADPTGSRVSNVHGRPPGGSAANEFTAFVMDAVLSVAAAWLRIYVSDLVSRSKTGNQRTSERSRLGEGPEHTAA
jgi:hypothetical protein